MQKKKREIMYALPKREALLHAITANQNSNNAPIPRETLSPQQIAVALGILTNALTVNSVLIDRDQIVQIVVTGSLAQLQDFLSDLELTPSDLMKMF